MFRLQVVQPSRAGVRPQPPDQQPGGAVPAGLPPLLPHLPPQLPLHAGCPVWLLHLRLDLRQVRPDELSDDGLPHLRSGRLFRVSQLNSEGGIFL